MHLNIFKNPTCNKNQLFRKLISHPLNLNFFKDHKNIQRALETLIQKMPFKYVDFFLKKKPIIFIPITGIYSCAIDQVESNYLILILNSK